MRQYVGQICKPIDNQLRKKRLASFVVEGSPRFLTGFWMRNPHTIRALLGAIVRGLECGKEVLLTLQPPPRDQRCRRE
jgi:hypothetical protein